ncbi:MAG: molybdopterin molybdotransferase MoeA [Actinomycetota bacterium]|nr:molybdopterin molybdotransferase MoeA [Actinomycetota bacterium]
MPESFLSLIGVSEALDLIFSELKDFEPRTEKVSLSESLKRVLARDLIAQRDLPGFERSAMDGFAVCSSDVVGAGESQPVPLELFGEVPMGSMPTRSVESGKAMRVFTGGMIPDGADAVVMVEDTELSRGMLDVKRGVAPGENIVRADGDVSCGELLISRGTALNPSHIGAMAGLGVTEVEVYSKPRVGVIATGDEIVPPEEEPGVGQIRDINTPALCAQVEFYGCESEHFGIVEDKLEKILTVAEIALSSCDVLLISGGSSMGMKDETSTVISRLGKPGILVHGLKLKPGKPTIAAICDGKPAFGLPGNPSSALIVLRELVKPVLLRLRGENQSFLLPPRTVEAVITKSISSITGRMEFVPVYLREDGGLYAEPVTGKSNLIGTLSKAVGLVRIKEESEGIEKGQKVIVELID